jgi:hypothetical protein
MNQTQAITFAEWQTRYSALRQRTERLSALIVRRARQTAQQAGLDPSIPFLHAHNALCGRHYGHPWPEVDYSLCRKVLWLEQRSFEPSRLLERIGARLWARTSWGKV